jgi:hypothetical protein
MRGPAQNDYYARPPSHISRGPRGTPLGRIVAGVFLGMMTWTIVMGVVAFVLLSMASARIQDAFNDAGTALSEECKAAIDAKNGDIVTGCSNDDATTILKYQSTK